MPTTVTIKCTFTRAVRDRGKIKTESLTVKDIRLARTWKEAPTSLLISELMKYRPGLDNDPGTTPWIVKQYTFLKEEE